MPPGMSPQPGQLVWLLVLPKSRGGRGPGLKRSQVRSWPSRWRQGERELVVPEGGLEVHGTEVPLPGCTPLASSSGCCVVHSGHAACVCSGDEPSLESISVNTRAPGTTVRELSGHPDTSTPLQCPPTVSLYKRSSPGLVSEDSETDERGRWNHAKKQTWSPFLFSPLWPIKGKGRASQCFIGP